MHSYLKVVREIHGDNFVVVITKSPTVYRIKGRWLDLPLAPLMIRGLPIEILLRAISKNKESFSKPRRRKVSDRYHELLGRI